MKRRLSNLACWLSLVLASPLAGAAPGQPGPEARLTPPIIDARTQADLDAAMQRNGQARVIVGLRSSSAFSQTNAGGPPLMQDAAAYRAEVARLQDGLLRALANPRGVRRFQNFSYLALTVDDLDLDRILRLPDVMSVRQDGLMSPHLDRSVPQVGADAAWAAGYRGAGQVVAVMDSGVDAGHPALAGKVVAEACFSTTVAAYSSTSVCPAGTNPGGADRQFGAGAASPCGINGCDHGTHVAGTAAGDSGNRSGVAPEAQLFGVQVFSRFDDPNQCGSLGTPCILSYFSDLVAGLDWVYSQRTNHAIASANISLGGGGYTTQSECDAVYPLLTTAISTLHAAGIAAAVSSGNSGYANRIGHPGCISDAISVGAVTLSDGVASFSNSASWLDLLAPGTSIDAPVPGTGFGRKSGTSMAAPHVAGAFAILRSAGASGSVDQLLAALKTTGVPVLDGRNQVTTPRIQVNEAVIELVGGGASSADFVLTPGQMETGRYGNRWGTDQNEVEVVAAFEKTGADFVLNVTGHDIDFNDEISVHLNGTRIGYLSKGPNDSLNGGDSFPIPAAAQRNGENEITFRERTPGWIWGVTNLLLSEPLPPNPAGIDVVLQPGVPDNGRYGNRWGTDQNEVEVVAAFQKTGADFVLNVTGHDIDYNDEISVHLNGAQIGYLSKGPNNSLNGGDSFPIPAAAQHNGENEITFRERTPGWIWGVTNLLLAEPAPPNPEGVDVVLRPGVQDTGRYGNRWGTDQNELEVVVAFQKTGADFDLNVTGHDIDFPDEISVHLNGQLIGYLSKGPNNLLNGGDTFPIPASMQQADENRVVFRERTPGWIWGVTNLLLTDPAPPDPADLTLVPGVMDTGQYGYRWGNNAHREEFSVAFQSTGANFELQVTAYDMDFNDEISVFLNGDQIGYLSKGPNNALNGGDTFQIPASLQDSGENRIVFRQRSPGWIWGVTRLLLSDTGT